jgi:hypothetical protein
MANSKISELTVATTPLAGTEELALLQSNDKRITVANFAAGAIKSNATTGVLQVTGPVAASTRVMTTPDANFSVARTDAAQTLTGNQTITNGNVVVSSGYGIDFSATAGTGTSELLADYEEGTFTPTVSGGTTAGTGTYTSRNGKYTKIGNTVYFLIGYILSDHTGTGDTLISGLPYASGATYYPGIVTGANGLSLTALYYIGGSVISPSGALIYFQQMPVGGGSTIGVPIDPVCDVRLQGFYFTS